jgi:hypothetical protein
MTTAKPLEEWQHHIAHTHAEHKGTAWCGASVWGEWKFLDIDHAAYAVKQQQRLQPCPACVVAVINTFTKAETKES